MQSSSDSAVQVAIKLPVSIGSWDIWRRLLQRLIVAIYRYLGGWGNLGEFSSSLVPIPGSRYTTMAMQKHGRARLDETEKEIARRDGVGIAVWLKRRKKS